MTLSGYNNSRYDTFRIRHFPTGNSLTCFNLFNFLEYLISETRYYYCLTLYPNNFLD